MSRAKNVWNQTVTTKQRRNVGDLTGLQKRLWHWLQVIDDAIDEAIEAKDKDECLRWLHSATQLSGVYVKAITAEKADKKLDELAEELGKGLSKMLEFERENNAISEAR